ncbi:MAG: glutamyl-tRNA reductase [Alphaproteobacteria bacterium]|nr:glutamyl-tRNA reductase [Alphaproteobacteria bacterium]
MTTSAREENARRLGDFHIIGLDHRTCPDPIREAMFVADEELPGFLRALRDAGFVEAMFMSTCDRVEIRAIDESADDPVGTVAETLAAPTGVSAEQLRPAFYHHKDTDAVRHLFQVSAALESQIIGEPQVLGQVRASHRMAAELGMVGGRLDPLLRASYTTAKRVRSETAIAEGPTSLIAAALRVARSIHGDLGRCRLAVLGADDLALLLAGQFKEAGLGDIILADRNPNRAAAAARELNAHVTDFQTRARALADADITLCATGDGQYSVTEEMVLSALQTRRRKPIFIVDLATPTDVDPTVERIPDAFVYDLDDLERLALDGQSGRNAAIADAQAIVEEEVSRFLGELAARDAAPLIASMRDTFEMERTRVLREKPGANADEATRLLVNRLLHRPSDRLRALASKQNGLDPRTEAMIRALLLPSADGDDDEGELGEF